MCLTGERAAKCWSCSLHRQLADDLSLPLPLKVGCLGVSPRDAGGAELWKQNPMRLPRCRNRQSRPLFCGLRGKLGTCCRTLFGHSRILLGGLIHRIHCRVDFLQPRRLFPGRLGDRRHVLVDLSDLRDDVVQRPSGPANEVDTGPDVDVNVGGTD